MSGNERLYITWQEVNRSLRAAADIFKSEGVKPKAIVGISRGGLIPAVILSHLLDVPRVEFVRISTYEGKKKLREAKVTDQSEGFAELVGSGLGKDVVIVDDIVDSGDTIQLLSRALPHALVAVLVAKEGKQDLCNIASTICPPSCWVVFPWETE